MEEVYEQGDHKVPLKNPHPTTQNDLEKGANAVLVFPILVEVEEDHDEGEGGAGGGDEVHHKPEGARRSRAGDDCNHAEHIEATESLHGYSLTKER